MRFGCRSRYISRYVNLKLGFLPFVVASIVAMVFFFAVFAARTPAMGSSVGRAWQLSQLVEGVLTACNPSHGSLSCVKTNSASFASAQARKRKIRSLLRRGRRARRARFPTCGVIRVAGYSVVWDCDPTLISPKEHQKERCGHSRSQRSFITLSWCASEYSVASRISCHDSHDRTRANVCQ